MSKPLFSVCLIARNEAKTVPRLIKSLAEFTQRGGQIILVDTGSTDDTAQIARDLGCFVEEVGDRFRIFPTNEQVDAINARFVVDDEEPVLKYGESLFDFTNARNYAASLAPTDWIAMPDCDEIFTVFDIDRINEAICTPGVNQLEYNFVFAHDQFGKPSVKFRHSKFYDRKDLVWKGVVHEVLSGNSNRKFLDEDVIYLEHFQNHETNRTGYLRGLALDCFLNQDNDRNSHYLARDLMWSGRYKSAIKEFKRHVAFNRWPAEAGQSMIFIGDCYKTLGDEAEAADWYHRAFLKESARREALTRLCQMYFEKNDYQKVACYAKAALEIPLQHFYANRMEDYEDRPHRYLYWALWYLGRQQEAKEHFDKAFSYKPLSSLYLREYQFFYDLPKVSILIPHLENESDTIRKEGLEKCVKSIENLNYPKNLVETIIDDDKTKTVPQKVKDMLEKATGQVIVYAANDTEFTPDSLIIAVIESKEKGLIAFNTGEVSPDRGNECEHFLIRKDLIAKLDNQEIFCTEFNHVGVDNYLRAQTEKLGEYKRSENAVMIHNHFTRGAVMDDVYKRAWNEEKVIKDRELLARKLSELDKV